LAGDAIRAFIALEMDDETRGRLSEAARTLSGLVRGVRWVAAGSTHLTLRFLGPSRAEALACLGPRLAGAAAACAPAAAAITGIGLFPDRGSPRILWVGLRLPPALLELQAACERAAVECGFPREARAFRPHLTLGRWKQRAARPSLPRLELGETELRRLVLFRSDLGRGGAVYTPLGIYPLGG
jgi:RNA 2',3'-cyclic 3'-phosphodiesterase